jgi:hypothetical protein
MTSNHDPLGGFEKRLLGELKSVVSLRNAEQSAVAPARTPLWRRPRVVSVASAGALALGATIGVPLLGGGSTTPSATAAFTVTANDDGSVTATVNRLEDAERLERQLEGQGVPIEVDYLPLDMECEQPRFTLASHSGRAVEFWFGDADAVEDVGHAVPYTLIVHPDRLGPNQTVVLEAGRDLLGPEDGSGPAMWATIEVADGRVKPCDIVPIGDDGLGRG